MTAVGAAAARLLAALGVQTTVVLVLALAAVAAARRRPAAFRHLILSSALAGLLLLPLLGLGPLGWRSPLVPRWVAAGAAAADKARVGEGATFREPRPAPSPALTASAAGRTEPGLRAAGAAANPGLQPSSEIPAPAASAVHPAAPPSAGRESGASVPGAVLAGVWAAGFLALLLRLSAGLAGAARWTAQGTPLEGRAWRALVDRFLALVSLRRPVRLRSHPAVAVPVTWGWRRPVVLFPDGADEWSEDERSSALFHELSHVKRADFLVMLLVRASLAAFWWNPLCWVAYRELRRDQEIACDELAIRAGIRPSAYAASLLAFRRAAGFRWDPSAALLGFAGRSSLETRLAAVLGQQTIFREVKMKTKLMIAFSLVALVALVGTARPAAGGEAVARAVLAETALPAPAPAEAALAAPAQAVTAAEPAAGQEKSQEAEKAQKAQAAEKAEKEKTAQKPIVVVTRKGEKLPIVITVTQGDEVKTLTLDDTVTITRGKDGEALVLKAEGGEPIVLEGNPLRLEIKGGGRLEVLKEGEPVELGEASKVEIVKEGERSGQTLVFRKREAGAGFTLAKPVREEPGAVTIVVEGAPAGEEGGPGWVVKEAPGKRAGMAWIAEDSRAADKEMLAKIQELQKQVEAIKAKKMEIGALEESLKKIEAELEARAKELEGMAAGIAGETREFKIVRKTGGETEKDGDVFVYRKGETKEGTAAGAKVCVEAGPDKGPISLVFARKGLTREDYDRATAELKKALPEGYKLSGSEFEEEAGSMRFAVAAPEGKPVDKALIKKLVGILGSSVAKK